MHYMSAFNWIQWFNGQNKRMNLHDNANIHFNFNNNISCRKWFMIDTFLFKLNYSLIKLNRVTNNLIVNLFDYFYFYK